MQKIIKYTLFSALIATLGLQSCKDSYFDDLSDNPNQVATPSLNTLLATSTYKAGLNNYNVASIILPYVQYTANPSASAAGDTFQSIDYSGTWDALYFAMADANEMKKLAVTQNASEYIGAADVLIAYNLIMVNDLWGDAPFSEAFNIDNLVPKYDKQQDVYTSSMALIDEAITELSKTTSAVKLAATSDLIYGKATTERANWLKMAYALKARLLNKVSKTSSYNPTAILDAVSKSFTSNDDDAGMQTFRERNFWATVALNNANQSLGGWLSEQLIDALNGTTYPGVVDPRLAKITDKTIDGKYIGTVNGAGNRLPGANTRKDENYISQNSPWSGNTSPIFIVTYAELKFIEAEAAFNTDRTRSYAAYLAGIRANMDKFQVAATDKEAYLAQPTVSVGAAALTKDLIFKEKYIATYLNPEAWNDARRFDYKYKDFGMPANAALPDFIRRLDYPQGERSKNGSNVPAEVPRTTKLWWDQ